MARTAPLAYLVMTMPRPSIREHLNGLPWLAGFVDELGAVPGVVGVALGGSRARGAGTPDSDVDLGLYYMAESPLDVPAIRRVVERADEAGQPKAVSDVGEWGPWINGGAWLRIAGLKVDLLYREEGFVRQIIADCARGRFRTEYQPGHPNAFHSHMLAGEAHYNTRLRDPDGVLADLAAATSPYPSELRTAIVRKFLWEADFVRDILEQSASRLDRYYAAGSVFRYVSCLVQVLFAVNGAWFVNEKGSLRMAGAFPAVPAGFVARAEALFDRLDAADIRGLIGEIRALLAAVTAIAG